MRCKPFCFARYPFLLPKEKHLHRFLSVCNFLPDAETETKTDRISHSHVDNTTET
jgi:hypothetical protein